MIEAQLPEAYVSVDVETAGPTPCDYSLLSIGACLVANPKTSFYVELRPIHTKIDEGALEVSGLSWGELVRRGSAPEQAMADFERWLLKSVPRERPPVFVAFNAAFDWAFVNDYFHRTLGRNPFGHAALDLKAYAMGLTGSLWSETAMQSLSARFGLTHPLTHNALQDAQDQAVLFRRMLAAGGPPPPG